MILDNTIIICEDSYKKQILEDNINSKKFLNLKFYTKKEFFKEYLFSYNNETIYYLKKKYNYKIDVIKVYLDNLYFVDDLEYSNNKLNFLKDLKKELNNNNLLIYNPLFKEYIKNYNILVIGYPYLYNYELKIFKNINAIIKNDYKDYKIDTIYEFNNEEEEINFIFKSIGNLLEKKIPLNKIKLLNVDKNYYNILQRLGTFYNIPVKIPTNNTLYNNIIGHTFLENIDNGIDYAIDKIKGMDNLIVNKIINICNKNINCLDKDIFISEFKKTKIDNFKLNNYLEIKNINDLFWDDEYVFCLNFNSTSIPSYEKDEKFLNDNVKKIINEKSTNSINKEIKEYTINKLKSIKNLVLTYKLNGIDGEYYPSSLINELWLKIEKQESDLSISYSKMNDMINYAKELDNYMFYNTITEDLKIYENNLTIPYNTYNNKYTKIDNKLLKEYLGSNGLILSYSTLNNYNKCAFRYYLSNILKIDKFNDTFEIFVGSMYHDVLEKCLHNNKDVIEEINNYINDSKRKLSIKEKFYIDIIKNDIIKTLNCLNNQKEYTTFDKFLYEQKITINKDKDIPVKFIGFVDKILYKEEVNHTLIAIIDYKTGSIDIDLKNTIYGLSLQLPIYLYLINNSNLFKNPYVVGFYLQYILNKDIAIDKKKSYEEIFRDNLKLVGYSCNDLNYLKYFDNTYKNSLLIKSLKVNDNLEFSKYSKILTHAEMNNLSLRVEKNIDESIDKILEADFSINPKKIGYENDIGCKFCHFKDICFKNESDYVILEKVDNLDFLKEDYNA